MILKALSIALLLTLVACTKKPSAPPPAPKTLTSATVAADQSGPPSNAIHAETGIAWRNDVDAAFTQAKSEHKPLFLYWGAVWCPPCNQVKATLFNRQDFIERSRFFIPVYVDGDSASAQRLGARFHVSAYPTMILFAPDGRELTRLPGEVDGEQYMRVLTTAMNGARPVKETLAAALEARRGESSAKVSPEDWRMLAYYSWTTDEQQLMPNEQLASILERLAQNCPADLPGLAARLELNALATAGKNAKTRDDKTAKNRVVEILRDPTLARENFDMLTYHAAEIPGSTTLAKSAERAELVTAWQAALDRFSSDANLSRADRLAALDAKVALAKLDAPEGSLPEPLLENIRAQAALADRETRDPYARQAVIDAAAELLADAGLMQESDALLAAEVKRSHSPYYFMLGLAVNAKKRGDKTAAIDWAEKAYAAADGAATRLQWGVSYLSLLIDLVPDDTARIEKAAKSVIDELEPSADTFYGRNQRSLERMDSKMATWNKDRQHQASMQRLLTQMTNVCGKLPAGEASRTRCDTLFHGDKGSA